MIRPNEIGTNTPLSWCKSSKRSANQTDQQTAKDYNNQELQFANEKRQTLSKIDKSVKGEIDAPIVDIVEMINNCVQYYTTSSCSGRVIVTGTGLDSAETSKSSTTTNNSTTSTNKPIVKKGLDWNFVSHEPVSSDQQPAFLEKVFGAKSSDSGDLNNCRYTSMWLKFEPFILHVRCCSLESARQMLQVGLSSGFRNSGIMLSSNGHSTVAIRCTASLEVPLAIDGKFIVDKPFLLKVLEIANDKMVSNFEMINQFKKAFEKHLETNLKTTGDNNADANAS